MQATIILLVLCGTFALSLASYGPMYYQPGFTRGPHGIAAVYRNDLRQVAVNHIAEKVGASDGTADYYGVPGAGKYIIDNRYGYGHQGQYGYQNTHSGYKADPHY